MKESRCEWEYKPLGRTRAIPCPLPKLPGEKLCLFHLNLLQVREKRGGVGTRRPTGGDKDGQLDRPVLSATGEVASQDRGGYNARELRHGECLEQLLKVYRAGRLLDARPVP